MTQPSNPGGLMVELLTGLKVDFKDYFEWRVIQDIFIERHYEPAMKDAIRYSPWGQITVLDLGCNTGTFGLFAADALLRANLQDFRIIGIDASKWSLDRFVERLDRIGDLPIKDKFCMALGLVGKREGFDRFKGYDNENSGMSHRDPKGNYEVEYLNLDRFEDQNINLIKCDIEGAEEDFISNYPNLLKRSAVFVCEFHHARVDVDKCRDLLMEYGFQCRNVFWKGNLTVETYLNREVYDMCGKTVTP